MPPTPPPSPASRRLPHRPENTGKPARRAIVRKPAPAAAPWYRQALAACIALAVVCALVGYATLAGRPAHADELKLDTGRIVVGEIISIGQEEVVIELEGGARSKFRRSQVVEIKRSPKEDSSDSNSGSDAPSPTTTPAPTDAPAAPTPAPTTPAATPAATASAPQAPSSAPDRAAAQPAASPAVAAAPATTAPRASAPKFSLPAAATPAAAAGSTVPVSAGAGAPKFSLPGGGAAGPGISDATITKSIPAGADGVIYGLDDNNKEVELRTKGAADFAPAKNSDPLRVGDEIRTREGKARIALRGDVKIRIPQRTHLVLAELSADTSKVTIQVKTGSIWSDMTAPVAGARDFKVVTPDLTAGVRGTVFKVAVDPDQKGSAVGVLEGHVNVVATKTSQSADVLAGRAVHVDEFGNLGAIEMLAQPDKDEWEEWMRFADEDAAKLNASLGLVPGGQIAGAMLQNAAADNARHAEIVDEANRNILLNRYGEMMDKYAAAFMAYARDTKHVPDPQTEGWNALFENVNDHAGWKGPYLQKKDVNGIPPIDPWKNPLTYKLAWGRSGNNVHGLIYSWGGNKQDNDGRIDDIISRAMFYQVPEIANSPINTKPKDSNTNP